MIVDWNKPLEIKSKDSDLRTNCHYVGFDPNRPNCPRVISYIRNVSPWTANVTESGEHPSFRVINVPEPPAWMVKAAEECAKVAMLAGPMDVRDEVAKEFIDIMAKQAKDAV